MTRSPRSTTINLSISSCVGVKGVKGGGHCQGHTCESGWHALGATKFSSYMGTGLQSQRESMLDGACVPWVGLQAGGGVDGCGKWAAVRVDACLSVAIALYASVHVRCASHPLTLRLTYSCGADMKPNALSRCVMALSNATRNLYLRKSASHRSHLRLHFSRLPPLPVCVLELGERGWGGGGGRMGGGVNLTKQL
jgi:hypothetical protein